jgi:GMP synthase (glutamine-hydrolysing)
MPPPYKKRKKRKGGEGKVILIIKQVKSEGPGIIGDFFEQKGFRVKIVELGSGERLPEDLSSMQAVVMLGGPMNVYEEKDYPFLKEENTFIKKILKAEIPFLGICLGAQLLAKAKGAAVTKASSKEMGWHDIDLTDGARKDPLFRGIARRKINVFQWHGDRFDVPGGGILLAESEICPQAFKAGKNAYGMQFHFEVTPYMVEEWLLDFQRNPNGDRDSIDARRILIEAYRNRDAFSRFGKKILMNFSRLIRKET